MTNTRPVELTMFPDLAPDRPRGPLLGSVVTGTNADLIAAIAPIYLKGRTVADVTYGRGRWWTRYQPPGLIAHDIDPDKGDGVDFRALPETDRSVDVVCYDPPYVASGTNSIDPGPRTFRERYGIDRETGYGHESDLVALILAGLSECARVARQLVLTKCMEFTSSRRFHDMPHLVKTAAAGNGLELHDQIVHHTGSGPGGHNIYTPIRTRRHHSYLLVFKVTT
jgi:hypothetical protein